MSFINEYLQKFDDLQAEIEEGHAEKDEVAELLSDIESDLEDAEEELRAAEQEEYNMNDALDSYGNDPDSGISITQAQIDKVRKRVSDARELVEELTNLRDDVDEYLNGYKAYDKSQCFQNIRALLKKSDVKIGQIEKKARVRIGYMSRLEKPDSTQEPSMQFIATAAKMLKVTVDELMYSKITELSDDEQTVKDFMSDLLDDTLKRNIHWSKLGYDILSRVHTPYEDINAFHPLLTADPNDYDMQGNPNSTRFISKFYPESKIRVKDGTYHALIPGIKAEIFIVWCASEVEDKYIPGQDFFEIYLVDCESKLNPVCTTVNAAPQIVAVVGELYKAAVSNSSQVYLNDTTKGLISQYRQLKDLPF